MVLDRSWTLLGSLGVVLGGSWGDLGGSRGTLGRPKIDPKIDPKLDAKTGRIATEKNGPNTTPVMVSELDRGRPASNPIRLEIYRNRF